MEGLSNQDQMLREMKPGRVYRRSELLADWPAADRDLKALLDGEHVRKAGPGLYYKVSRTKFGTVKLPDDRELVSNFLRDDDFLLLNESWYTSLVSGLTQVSAAPKVVNSRRHGFFTLGGRPFEFVCKRRYPAKLTKEYLMVDLLDNFEQTEDGHSIKEVVKPRLLEYDPQGLFETARKYGKRSTEKYLRETLTQ